MAKLLLLEDEVDYRQEIADFLKSEGHQVLEAGSAAEFTPLMDVMDIALIDVGLPDADGFEVAALLRKHRNKCGIIMLTAQGGINHKIASLRGGADHYLVKPVRYDELLAHIKALERRMGLGGWRLDTIERKLYAPNGHAEILSEHELKLFELLAAQSGQAVSRRTIANAFGADWLDYDERRLEQIVSRLRRRWRENCPEELPFRTEHGKGYSFCADIEVF
ncbi:response regulator transcription factor [Herminiimonas glaciei]|uniref:Response regulator transcription factor n=1 Tax=Herminiimonas glaciei TaxID=523788 RepID=A0ABW2IFD1_9BURK